MGCEEGDVSVMSVADFNMSDFFVCHSSFRKVSWFLFINLKTRHHLLSFNEFPYTYDNW